MCLEPRLEPPQREAVYSCDHCECDIYSGQEVVVYEDCIFCDDKCLAEYVVDNSRILAIEDALGR